MTFQHLIWFHVPLMLDLDLSVITRIHLFSPGTFLSYLVFIFYLMVSIEGFCMLLSLSFSLSLSLSNIILSSPFRVLYSHMQWKVHLVTVYIVREFYSGAWNTIWYSTSYSTHNDKGQKWIIDITMVHTEKEISSRQ